MSIIMIEQNIQRSTLNDEHFQFNSTSVVKVSTVRKPNFIRHKVNTNLNLKPQLFLSNEAESYGVHYSSGDNHSFSSFQMASMFLEYIGKVDIISNAENIKNLCKVPYNKKSVSIMVHRFDKTLLFDEFDIEKYLTQNTSEEWTWLKKFFYNNIVKSSDTTKVECITLKKNNFKRVEHKNLVSKFLHHSIGLELHNDQIKNVCNEIIPLGSPSLKQPTPEEVFPDFPKVHRLFNRNVLWDFKDLQILIGTDLPIFRNDNNSSLSAKLRDMSKPLSMLTGIDYWLENLMNDIPEIEFCYHINGIVQKYEQVKTEDIPYLNGSTFSPNLIHVNMQKIISFLKSNTCNVGHTYWLFKGKDDDEVKLYDLTTLCSESLIDSPNPFTFPVTTLLCRVAYKLMHDLEDVNQYNGITIIPSLNNSLKLLDKTKHPQVVATVNYMLSDIYIKLYNNSLCTVKKDLTNYAIASYDFRNGTYSIDIQNEDITFKTENIFQISECSISSHSLTVLYSCFYKALVLNYPLNAEDSYLCYYKLKEMLCIKASEVYLNLCKKCRKNKNFGIALKCCRRIFECLLHIENNQVLNIVLEYSGDCFFYFINHWNDIEQYISEYETDEMYDFEIREMLLKNSKDFTNKDLNRIPIKIKKSVEDMLKTAEYFYTRTLVLETNTEKIILLKKRIGSVYNELNIFYLNEMIRAVRTCTTETLKVKLKWLKKKSEYFFKLGIDIFKNLQDMNNFVQMHRNLADIYKSIGYSNFKIPLKEFTKENNIYFMVINIYTNLLSELDNRSSNPNLWDTVYYENSSVLYYLSAQNYAAFQRNNSKSQQECFDLFKKALEYCDLENDTPNRFEYEFRSAYIHYGLASLIYFNLEKNISMKSPKVDFGLSQIRSYYNFAFDTYLKIRCPLDCLGVLKEMIMLDMKFIDGTLNDDEHIKSILKTLKKCDTVFQMLEEKNSTECLPSKYIIKVLYNIEDEQIKLNLINSLNKTICKLLMSSMIKLAKKKELK
ncbi:uncharacterized protein LOC112604083 [Melanaphis sacchari]|uniref:uncharacterized protein LOC112604083 n=1 Tax=Melanaphis sacchari TaxID=742174 RepID=UPI000DC15992|nr:uncharacterized protein LOC112604083 [Melanaphis sacchari]